MKNPFKLYTKDQNIFFTSDTHFGHANILKFCSRPYVSTYEMNEAIISNWNSVVKPNDIVFHLGDIGFGNKNNLVDILNRLNGRKILVMGNHDRRIMTPEISNCFEHISPQLYINVNDQRIYLNHFPMLCFDGVYGRSDNTWTWQLFGHVHSGPYTSTGLDCQRLIHLFPTQYDVGVDNNSFTPISFDEVKEIITNQQLSQNLYRGTN